MKVKKSIVENFIYNMLYQVLVTALPILTTPYTARVLGLHANGIHSYTEGIVTYFMLFGAVGTAMYGTRKIAYERDDQAQMSQTFWEIVLLRSALLGATLVVYIAVLCVDNEYAYLYRIQTINILATAIDISWFFQGVEDFKKVTIRNMIVKAIYVACLFLFIKEPSDLPLYVFLIVGSAFAGNAAMWLYLKEYLGKMPSGYRFTFMGHLRGSVTLFIPQITNYVYALLDRSMLKWITGDTDNVGIYDQAQRLVRAVTAILQSIGYVMLARIANLNASNEEEEIRYYIRRSMNFTLFLALPIMFGIIGTAKDFIPLFLGPEYLRVIPVLQLLGPLVLTMSLNSVLGVQLLISVGKEKEYAIATTSGALVNVAVNLFAIPRIGITGACISSLLAECVVFLISFGKAKEYLQLRLILKDNGIPLMASVLMFFSVLLLGNVDLAAPLKLLLETAAGAGIYFGIMIVSKNETMALILNKAMGKFRLRKK